MLKLVVVLALVICSHLILSTEAFEDEDFSEFDGPETKFETAAKLKEESTSAHQHYQQADEKISAKSSANKDEVDSDQSKPDIESQPDLYQSEDHETNDGENKAGKSKLNLVNVPAEKITYRWETYYIEIMFVLALVVYAINYTLGSSKNRDFAHFWYDNSREILKQQFVLVGGAPQYSDGGKKDNDEDTPAIANKKQRGLIKGSESSYTLWCSGRVGLDGLLIEMMLLKRQDLFSMALNLLKVTRDTLIFRYLLPSDGYENFVFCLASKTVAAKLARETVDISTFCSKRKPISQYGVDLNRLFVLSELSDVVPFILDQHTVSFLKKYEKLVNYIHISDQFSSVQLEEVPVAQRLAKTKRMAIFSFVLPTKLSDQAEMLLFTTSLLDRLRKLKLAKDSKQKSDKNRQKIADILQKEEFLHRQEKKQALKEEQRRLEKEKIYNEDDPEKQKRWEKKEAKRELKKNKMRVKQLKVKSM